MSKTTMICAVLLLALAVSLSSHAVPPAYEGQFGNPEEPALRVVKWPWLGFRKLVSKTHDGLHRGIHKHPPASICKGTKGAICGTGVFIDHTARGMVYAPLPPKGPLKKKRSYEDNAMLFIEMALNSEAQTGDWEAARQLAGEPKPLEVRPIKGDVKRAQRRYVPLLMSYKDRVRPGEGNLLRLGR
jgi:hypothetical protein